MQEYSFIIIEFMDTFNAGTTHQFLRILDNIVKKFKRMVGVQYRGESDVI